MRIRIPLTLKFAVLILIAIPLACLLSYQAVVDTSLRLLYKHEEVDLRDETRLKCETVKAHVAALRRDVLALTSTLVVRQAVELANRGDELSETLAQDVELALQSVCLADALSLHEQLPADVRREDFKPYTQVRLMDNQGREIFRVASDRRKIDPTESSDAGMAPFFKDDDSFVHDSDSQMYDNRSASYFIAARKLSETNDERLLNRSYLSQVDLNVENGQIEDIDSGGNPTLRGWAPIVSESGFQGIVVINLDFEIVLNQIDNSGRHLIYVTNDDGQFLSHPNRRLAFAWFRNAPVSPKSFAETDWGQQPLWDDGVTLEDSYSETKFSDDVVLDSAGRKHYWLDYRGRQIASISDDRTFSPEDWFSLAQFDTSQFHAFDASGVLDADRTNERIESFLARLRSVLAGMAAEDSGMFFKVPGAHQVKIDNAAFSANANLKPDSFRDLISQVASECDENVSPVFVTKCESFAAYAFRIYLFPGTDEIPNLAASMSDHPRKDDFCDRHLTILMAFSREEMEAALGRDRFVLFMESLVFACVIAVGSIIAGTIVIGPLRRLTAISKQVSEGDFDVVLPRESNDEVGELVRGFSSMIREVRYREERLEGEVDDRTKQLRITLEELRRSQEMREKFFADVSHELRTPLTIIKLEVEELSDSDLDDEQQEYVGSINDAVESLTRLIKDLLDYQKLALGELPLERKQFDIAFLIRKTAEMMRKHVEANRLSLTVSVEDDLGMMVGDSIRLQQVLNNLLSNAIKFTDPGGSIQVIAATDSKHKNYVRVSVRDTGWGMTGEQQKKLFKPFTKILDRSKNPTGTGLGLALCRQICEALDGWIQVESEPGKGSLFTIYLPMGNETLDVEIEQQAAAEQIVSAEDPNSGEAAQSTSKVLVIDDNDRIRRSLQVILKKHGFEVIQATRGADGLELAKEHQPDLVTLDVQMNGIDGWATLSALKTDRETAHIPVVMITVEDDRQKGYALGASDFLCKPFAQEELMNAIHRLLGDENPTSVLVVDDEPRIRQLASENLRAAGFTVLQAENGVDALELTCQEKPSLILLDLLMPSMDGFDFLDALRKDDVLREIPVIVMTAKALTTEDRNRLTGRVSQVMDKADTRWEQLLGEIETLVLRNR